MKKILVWLASSLFLFISATTKSFAAEHDPRVAQMQVVLAKYNSPMLGHEELLIKTAEKYGLDWTLLAAIAGTESSFGKRMPHNCINPYGWGIYGSNKLCFKSFEEAIEGVASGLAKKYNTTSLATIARTYNKVSTDSWTRHTEFFMKKIKTAAIPVSTLPVTL